MTTTKRKRIRKPKVNSKQVGARPTIFHQFWADKICSHIERGYSLRGFTEKPVNPTMKTVMIWLKAPENEEFRQQYARAREESADATFDHVGNLAEKAAFGMIDPAAARVAIEARKWMAGKMKPKKYGDKLELGGAGRDGAILVQFAEGDEKLM